MQSKKIKASIILATCNKNKYLPNTLYSIARQKTSFEFEVCIADDLSDVDPEPIIKKFLPDAKYKKLIKKAGPRMASLISAEMMSPDSEVVVLSSCDVIYVQSYALEELVNSAKDKTYTTAEVVNTYVNESMWRSYDESQLLKMCRNVKGNPSKIYYAGSRRPDDNKFQFLCVFKRTNLRRLVEKDGAGAFCDGMGNHSMNEEGYQIQYLDHIKGIHQLHPKSGVVPCSIFETCRLKAKCMKRNKSIRQFRKLYGNNTSVAIGKI